MSKAFLKTDLPRPFLKWVGGKRQLLPELRKCVQASGFTGRYHEPFIGGGALFFDLYCSTLRGGKYPHISDNNQNLIDAYMGVRDHVEEVIALLKKHAKAHSKDYYYAVRAKVLESLPERTARIIYLNRTCFNGLYRENSKGQFNVPMGSYKNPKICDEENLRAVSLALNKAKVKQGHFRDVLQQAKSGDFVYFDPPYHPVSKTSSFTSYHKLDFAESDQEELAEVASKLKDKGVFVLLSNSMTPFIKKLYKAHGFTIDTVHATRLVNSKASKRGAIEEALIRSFDL